MEIYLLLCVITSLCLGFNIMYIINNNVKLKKELKSIDNTEYFNNNYKEDFESYNEELINYILENKDDNELLLKFKDDVQFLIRIIKNSNNSDLIKALNSLKSNEKAIEKLNYSKSRVNYFPKEETYKDLFNISIKNKSFSDLIIEFVNKLDFSNINDEDLIENTITLLDCFKMHVSLKDSKYLYILDKIQQLYLTIKCKNDKTIYISNELIRLKNKKYKNNF